MTRNTDRWQQIAAIYELAVDQDESTRDAFLSQTCAGDEELRSEVESLLRQDAARVLLDRSVWATAAPLLDDGPDRFLGARLGPYRIDCVLGAGGMGDVYRAVDTRLDRAVAIKVLPAGIAPDHAMRARFADEARAIAALTHPHICTLYDVGRHEEVDFLVMEYLEGDTLAARLADRPLSVQEAIAHAIEIARALEHAHGHGVVHRDLKPANIMLTAGGAKLLDFGLAQFRQTAQASLQQSDVPHDTNAPAPASAPAARSSGHEAPGAGHGTILGTIRYMAPEQIRGADADARGDLFSFGAVVFEMLTGRRAFEGDTVASVRAAILAHHPPRISALQPLAPAALDDVVNGCLVKNPDDRYQTAAEVVRDLQHAADCLVPGRAGALALTGGAAAGQARRRWEVGVLAALLAGLAVWIIAGGLQRWPAAVPSGPIRSVAVLPFADLSGGPEQAYFADGMTVQLIAHLAMVRGLRVISPASVMAYRTARKPIPTIARELQVDAVVEGTVARSGSQVRITARLIRGATGEVLRTQSFEGDLRDVLTLQGEMARGITQQFGITLTPRERARMARARPVDPEAHRQVLLGRHHAARSTEEGLRRAVDHFDAAVAADPANALAHAGLAEAYTELAGFYTDPREAMPKARRAAETALRLDETLAEAHAALGYVHLVYDWDGPAAQRALVRALELNPTLAKARLNYAAYLTTQARHDEAVREIRRALDLDPRSIRTHAFGTVLLLFTRRYDEAIELAGKGLEFEPHSGFTLAFQGVAYAQKGRFTEAVANVERAARLDNSLTILALQAHVLAVAGRRQQAEAVIRHVRDEARRRYFCPYEIATAYVSLGDRDTAYDFFRKGTDERADCMAWLGVEPWIDSFRSDPRYRGLLQDVGLTPHVR